MDIKTLNSLIRDRRSVFPNGFSPDPVPGDAIQTLLENANWAPTHKHTEPWRFQVLQGKALEQLGDFLAEEYRSQTPADRFSEKKYEKKRSNPTRSSAVIAICMHRDPEARIPEWEEVAAVACAVQNLWLSASALGYGGYWSTPSAITGRPAILDLPEGQQCLGIFYLGVPKGEKPVSKREPIAGKVTWKDDLHSS